jgi:hypothetical protein
MPVDIRNGALSWTSKNSLTSCASASRGQRRTGKTLPRDKRGGWWLTPDQLAAIEGGS